MSEIKKEPRAAILLADGCEEIEALTTVDLCFRAGVALDKISIQDTVDVTSSHKVRFQADLCVKDADLEGYDMLILPGGMPGTMNLKACEPLCGALIKADRQGKWIAAICAAPSVLGDLGLLKGRRATCNPSWEEKVAQAGANLTHEEVTVDGRIITSQGMGTSTPFALAIIAALQGQEAAEAMARKIVWHMQG